MEIPRNSSNYTAGARPGTDAPVELTAPRTCAGLRLDQALARLLPAYSRNRLAQWVQSGRVQVDGRLVEVRHRLQGGEKIRVMPGRESGETAFQPQPMPLAIVYEDDTLLVIDKPAGLVVHPGSGNPDGTLLNALLAHAPQLAELPRAGIVHRLDKDTSGLLVVAKTLVAHTDLVRQLQARSVRRIYLALAHGSIAGDGRIDAPVGRHPVSRTRMAVVARGRQAVTHYQVVERYPRATLLHCRLETGRTHQIRVHLDSIGHPLFGDPVYGGRKKRAIAGHERFPRQALHATELGLVHPASGQPVSWHSPLPDDMRRLIDALRSSG